jgi:hypothetical protein
MSVPELRTLALIIDSRVDDGLPGSYVPEQAFTTLSRSRGSGKCGAYSPLCWEGAAKGMITSFIIRYLGWQAGIRVVCPTQRLSAHWVAPAKCVHWHF